MSGKKEKRGLIILGALLVLMVLLLNGCNSYTTMYTGVGMRFVPGMPMDTLFYYGPNAPNSGNDIIVAVEVRNLGSSWTRGGIFLSGYDPTMFQFIGINPSRTGGNACWVDIGNIGFSESGFSLRCDNFGITSGSGGTLEVSAGNLFGSGGIYAGAFDTSRLAGGIDFYYQRTRSGQQRVTLGAGGFDLDYANNGRLLITMLQGIDFSRNFGLEYFLEGNTPQTPGGGITELSFEGNIVNWPAGPNPVMYTDFMITNCYLYTTYAAPTVCIDPMPFSTDAKVCMPAAYVGTGGQGAPVAITGITQESSPSSIVFTIHVKNVGGGEVYDPGKLEMCSPYYPAITTQQDKNIVYIGDIRVSGDLQILECTPNNYVRLDPATGEGTIICSYQIPYTTIKSAYQTPLVVELWYGYSQAMLKRVMIKRALYS